MLGLVFTPVRIALLRCLKSSTRVFQFKCPCGTICDVEVGNIRATPDSLSTFRAEETITPLTRIFSGAPEMSSSTTQKTASALQLPRPEVITPSARPQMSCRHWFQARQAGRSARRQVRFSLLALNSAAPQTAIVRIKQLANRAEDRYPMPWCRRTKTVVTSLALLTVISGPGSLVTKIARSFGL